MPRYSVLMTTADYVEVEAKDPRDAEMVAWGMYKDGEIRPEHPEFICEEADLIEEEHKDNDFKNGGFVNAEEERIYNLNMEGK